jgi:2-C-methyl-D-erythritol 4-phosphate cytidylyltransferase
MNKEKIVIIVAGGKGERMQADIPKQFLEIKGKPILMHTIEVFLIYNSDIQPIVVLPAIQIEFWKDLCKKHNFKVPHEIIVGGSTRFESVKNGLKAVKIPSIIAVHDGVRPLVSIDTIARCFDEAEKNGAAIPVIELVDSIRQVTKSGNQSVDRNNFKLVQTPQIFDGELLKNAYQQEYSAFFTDDASVVESLGVTIKLVEGNRKNIKITNEYDLKLAEAYLT